MFHRSCLEHKEKMYKDTPTRCPLCGYIIDRVRSVHFLPKKEVEEKRSKMSSLEDERMKLLVQIEEIKERIARL